MTKYIVAFDDDDLKPWTYEFVGSSLNDIEDKVINYIINLYELEGRIPTDYHDFKKYCRDNNIYIGQIKEIISDFD